jgi:hypothetical protein
MFFKKFVDNIPTGYLITEENLRHVLVEVDFDKNPPPLFFESLGYAVVVPTERPAITPYQFLTEYETRNEDMTWQQNWQINEFSDAEKQEIYNTQLQKVKAYQDHLLEVYAQQMEDPSETEYQLLIIRLWIDATNTMDLSDPFNVKWPTEDDINHTMNDLLVPDRAPPTNNLTTVRTV